MAPLIPSPSLAQITDLFEATGAYLLPLNLPKMFPSLGAVTLLVSAVLGQGYSTPKANGTSEYVLKQGPLDTPWTDKVGTNPWPEYPRPQMARSEWKNLNGVWQYRNASGGESEVESPPFGQDLGTSVLVPFCLESALSGVMGNYTIHSWYRTTFDVLDSWTERVLLNFAAVDYQATVFVNGKQVANHTGGYWAFNIDITDQLNKNGTNELVVFVFDPTNMWPYNVPIGKQKLIPEHIFYTPCSGIWQTVWLESTPVESIERLDINAGADGKVDITVHTTSNVTATADFTLYEPNTELVKFKTKVPVNKAHSFVVDSPQLWSPDSPTLYNITVTLGSDTVQSYTGFRTISKGVINGVQRPLLNGEFVFMFGTLDQGYWPDGLHSPPSLEAMVYDLKALKEVGYNMLRKHIKVEPALFYQAADQLGLMLIQDMPALSTSSVFINDETAKQCPAVSLSPSLDPDTVQKEFDRQLAVMVNQLKSYPSIVTWVIYNEGWGQPWEGNDGVRNTSIDGILTDYVRKIDPTRLIDSVTGWHDHGVGDFHDNHHYSSPQCGTPWYSTPSTPYNPETDHRIAIQGEFGGIGQNISEEHAWKVAASINAVNNTYELDATPELWNLRAHMVLKELEFQIQEYACSGAVWTQTTDVEGEVNGMLTYDRRVNRMDKEMWRKDIQGLYNAAAKRAQTNGTMGVEGRGVGGG
ncbi:putative hydrolase [Paraphaeosphaeria sporulosa]|uniref:Putative hydrolase n=1 Tax=Paraphaeosphaeria sporulosa TaxID=1460663 RepID=A0A177CWL3_9PLEO|nr:putative hydrolase [Paraphaeosphaeria sporulosa]OAG11616.1 putative hydrolase [Paraphaeosphaeria sporulosa]